MKMSSVRLLLCSLLCIELHLTASATTLREEWNEFKTRFNKTYKDANDESLRRCIWQKELCFINQHNDEAEQGKHTYTLAINQFADMTTEEYSKVAFGAIEPHECQAESMQQYDEQLLRCSRQRSRNNRINYGALADSQPPPAAVDWRDKGYVTPVKNQGSCSSCWAFSATGALEGQLFKATGKLVSLSEQHLVDCSDNHQCVGGWPVNAFDYVRDHGVTDQTSYPYEQRENTASLSCRAAAKPKIARCEDFIEVEPKGDEMALMKAVATVGPVSVVIYSSLPTLKSYGSGIYNDPRCVNSGIKEDHAVLVVGYGSKRIGSRKYDYWIVKNSWTTSWGMKGYVLIERNKSNMCNIASVATYPFNVTPV